MNEPREWYLLQTKARQEGVAQENLDRQDYETWLPRLRLRTRRGPRIEALFPGYLFVRLHPHHDNFGPIRSTIGVLRLVQFGAAYARVPDALVAELMAAADPGGICESVTANLRPGDAVEIVHGALSGYTAIVQSVRGRDRIALLLDITGRHVSVVASQDSLQTR